jgi:hypothetical protein
MIKFIKKLLGLGPAELAKVQEARSVFIPQTPTKKETIREILTPPTPTPVVTNATPNSNKTLEATYIPPTKPVNKVKAIGDSTPSAVASAIAPKPANKQRRPYRGRNPKAKTEVNTAQQPAKKK